MQTKKTYADFEDCATDLRMGIFYESSKYFEVTCCQKDLMIKNCSAVTEMFFISVILGYLCDGLS